MGSNRPRTQSRPPRYSALFGPGREKVAVLATVSPYYVPLHLKSTIASRARAVRPILNVLHQPASMGTLARLIEAPSSSRPSATPRRRLVSQSARSREPRDTPDTRDRLIEQQKRVIAQLRDELKSKRQRIIDLEADLASARKAAQAKVPFVIGSGRGKKESCKF